MICEENISYLIFCQTAVLINNGKHVPLMISLTKQLCKYLRVHDITCSILSEIMEILKIKLKRKNLIKFVLN